MVCAGLMHVQPLFQRTFSAVQPSSSATSRLHRCTTGRILEIRRTKSPVIRKPHRTLIAADCLARTRARLGVLKMHCRCTRPRCNLPWGKMAEERPCPASRATQRSHSGNLVIGALGVRLSPPLSPRKRNRASEPGLFSK